MEDQNRTLVCLVVERDLGELACFSGVVWFFATTEH
jgi:hypothetical protein